jgi:MFS family permease
MQAIVVAWTVYDLTKDPLMLGMVGLAEAIPAIGAALPMGYVVDTMNKKRSILVASLIVILSAIATGLLVQPFSVGALGVTWTVGLMLFMVVVNGFARSIYSPSMFSALSRIVPRELLSRATAAGSAVWQGAMVTGPMAAGLIYGELGVDVAATSVVVTMAVSFFGIAGLPDMPPIRSEKKGKLKDDITEGLRFILKHQVILGALSLDMFAVLFGGAVALLPVFADQILHVDASGLGVLRAAPSIGSVLFMTILSIRPPERNTGRTLMFAIAGFGLATIAFACSTTFWLSVVLLVIIGSFDAVSVVVRATILQLFTPDEMRGRVAAANTMFISSSNEIGALESGVAARLIGTVPSVIFGGIMTLIIVSIVAFKAPLLRRLELRDP